jgi:hypothetical protein
MVGICIFISVIFLCLNEQRFLAILEEKFEDTKGEIEGQAMCEAGTANFSGVPGITPVFSRVRVALCNVL